MHSRGKAIGLGVHMYVYIMCVCEEKKLNGTLALESPFQILAVYIYIINVYRARNNIR